MNDTQQHEQAGELIRRCSEAETGGDIPALKSAAQEALQLAQFSDDPSLAAAGNYYLGRASLRQGSLPEARQHFEKAQALSRTANARQVEADTLRSLGIVYLYQGESSLSMAAFEQAVGLHRAIDDHKGECFALNNMGSLAIRQGDLDHARAWYEESLQAAEASGDPDAKLVVLMSLGDLEETYLGDFVKARQYYQEILRVAREQQNDLNIAIACSGIGSTSLFLGDLASAEPALLEAARLNQSLERWVNLGWEFTGLGLLNYWRNETVIGIDYCQRAVMMGEKSGEPALIGRAWITSAYLHAANFHLDQTEQCFKAALDASRAEGQEFTHFEAQVGLAGVSFKLGETPTIIDQLAFLEAHPDVMYKTILPARIYQTCYQVLAASGNVHAHAILAQGIERLQARAAKLADSELREMFLAIPPNRDLLALRK